MNSAMKAGLVACALTLSFGVSLSRAIAQIVVTPPHFEFGDHHWRHDDYPYRYEDRNPYRYWHHRHWHHHYDDDED